MKIICLTAIAVATVATLSAPADAAQGCGRGFHRGAYGACRPNGPAVVAPRVGIFYPGRGYWHGGRYWGHRYHWRGGWRYR